MRRALPLLCLVAIFAAACTSDRKAPEQGRVMVIGIDGGTWSMLDPLMKAGQLPNIKKLYDEGLHGILESRNPIISPVVWTTIFTGFGWEAHGVKDWKTSQSTHRKVNAIWQITRKAEKKTSVFNVPSTWPPEPVLGVMVSGFPLSGSTFAGNTGEVVMKADLDAGKLPSVYKDSLEEVRKNLLPLENGKWSNWFPGKVASRPSFKGVVRGMRLSDEKFYLTPMYRNDDGLVITEPKQVRGELAAKFGEPYIPEGPGWSRWEDEDTPTYLYQHLDQVFGIQSKAALEYVSKPWDLFLYVMTFVDRVSHPYWAYGHAADYPGLDLEKAKKSETAVADSYRRSDEELGRILAAAEGEYYVMIVSDHGFQSSADRTKAIGTHNPDGIYMLWGPGISPKEGQRTFIEDVTPTILYLMGLPAGRDMEGTLFPDVHAMIGRQPTFIETYEVADRDATEEPVDDATWEQLRGLGYVDGAPPRAGAGKDGSPAKPGAAAKPGAPKPEKGAPKPGGAPKPEAGAAMPEKGAAAEPEPGTPGAGAHDDHAH